MSTMMGYEPYHPTASSFSSSTSSTFRRWYAEVTTPTPHMGVRRGRTEAHYDAPFSSSTQLRHSSSSPHRGSRGRVFRASSTSSVTSALDRELSQAAEVSSQFRVARTRERGQLQELNDRFAGFVERVHELELQNRSLEVELGTLQRSYHQPQRLGVLYEQEARALRAAMEQARAERQDALGHRESVECALAELEARRREESPGRRDSEARLLELRAEADHAALARAEAEKRAEALLDELAFLKKIHEEEVADLQAQIEAQARAQAEMEGKVSVIAPDLSGALRDIRTQYERLAAQNARTAEEWFRGKVETLSESVALHGEAARASRGEAGEVRGQLQARLLDIDACRGVNCSLEKQLLDVEERQAAEVTALQDLISELEGELGSTKQEMSGYLKDYQALLNVKMALDIEIAAYRKLLEGEESRFSSVGMVGGASSSIQYSSHGLSVVAPSSFSRPVFASGLRSAGGSYLATSRLHLGSTFVASRPHKVEATPQPEEEEEEEDEKVKEKDEEVEVEGKVEGGEEKEEGGDENEEKEEGGEEVKGDDEDKEVSKEKGGEGGDEEEEKQDITEDTKEEGGERGEETKQEQEAATEDKEVTEQIVEKELSGDSVGVKEVGKDKDKADKKDEEKEVEKAEEEEKKAEQEDTVKPKLKGGKEGGKEAGKDGGKVAAEDKQESQQPQGGSKKKEEEAATEKRVKTKEEK